MILPMKAVHELTDSSFPAVFKIIERGYAIHLDGVRSPMPIIAGAKLAQSGEYDKERKYGIYARRAPFCILASGTASTTAPSSL